MPEYPDATRLAIGPANFAGQAFQWACAARRYLNVDAFSFSTRASPVTWKKKGYQFAVDRTLPHHRLLPRWAKRIAAVHLLGGTTHIAVDGFLPIFDRSDRSHAGNEVDLLRNMRLQVALVAHGSDVRDPDAHMDRYPHSYFTRAPKPWVQAMRDTSLRNRRTAERFQLPVFVSTPDLLLDVPSARWLPLTVELSLWHSARAPLGERVPTVLHAPSRRIPPIKGTEYVDHALQRLDKDGLIRFVSTTGVPHHAMRDLVARTDVVIDQILTGSYGVAAVEGMAAGRLVLGYVSQDVRRLIPDHLPIVDAPPPAFEDVIRTVVANPDAFIDFAAAGPGFTRQWHNGRAAAQAFEDFVAE